MDGVLLLIMTGLCAVTSHAEFREYHFVSDLKTWTEAQSYCREKYTDLATIDNMEEVTILNNMAEERQIQSKPWIGLYNDVNSWRWSLSDRSFYKHGETEFRRWVPGEPNRPNTEFCAVMPSYLSGQWWDTLCENRHHAVCSDVKGPDVTFVLTDTPMTWTEAQSFCREHYTDLASVRNEAENQKVHELVPVHSASWIGLFRDPWQWSDGRNSSLSYWSDGQPDGNTENCVAADFSNSGRWRDLTCDYKTPFICYRQLVPVSKKVMKVRFERKNSSLDLNDPAVMEAILKQLKQKLKDQGVNDDIKLSWKEQSDGKVLHKEEKKTKK